MEQMVRRSVPVAGVMAEPDTVLYNLYGAPFNPFMSEFKEWFTGELARLEQVNRSWFHWIPQRFDRRDRISRPVPCRVQ